MYKEHTSTHAQGTDPRVALRAEGELPWIYLGAFGGEVDAATLVAALGAGPPPPECRWGRRPHRGATACRLLERDDRGVDGPGVEGDNFTRLHFKDRQ